jgi:uncharacterized protein YjbI with pentapeptide repeats
MEFRPRFRRSLAGGNYTGSTAKGDFRCGLALQSTFRDMWFVECKMEQINFSGSKFENCHFLRCNLSGANFNATTFYDSVFDDCTLDMAGFRGASLHRTRLVAGRAEYSSFEEALVRDCRFDTQLHGADLRFSSSRRQDMGDSNLWGAALNVSCRNFKNVTYSEQQVELFLGLIAKTSGNDRLRSKIRDLISAKSAGLVDRIVDQEDAD